MSFIDTLVIVAFSLMTLMLGLSLSKNSNGDVLSFFAAGGAVRWRKNSLSLFMGFVSVNTFVVWGSIAFSSGWVAIAIQWSMSIASLLTGLLIAPEWHKAKSLTALENILNRLVGRKQKTYLYICLGKMVFLKVVCLYAVAIVLQVITGVSFYVWVGLFGITIIFHTTFRGLWAVVATNVLQFIILIAAGLILLQLSFDKIGSTIVSLPILLGYEFAIPMINAESLYIANSVLKAVIVPVCIVAFFEICLIFQNEQPSEHERFKQYLLTKV